MGIQFDPINKLIKIISPTKEITAQEIYNASMEWAAREKNMGYEVPIRAEGNPPIARAFLLFLSQKNMDFEIIVAIRKI